MKELYNYITNRMLRICRQLNVVKWCGTYTLILFTLAGCTVENLIGPDVVEEKGITFDIRIPSTGIPQNFGTRTVTPSQESAVQEIDILVFEPGSGNFLYHTLGKLITRNPENSNADYRFIAMLKESPGSDLVFIANAHLLVDSFLSDQGDTPFTKNQLQAGLVLENSNRSYFDSEGKWDAKSPALFPMWGELINRPIVKEAVIDGISLHRMVARINLYVAAANFDLREVYLCNSVTHGALIPGSGAWEATWKPEGAAATDPAVGKATGTTLPSGWGRTASSLCYTFNNNEIENRSCINEIYTFETPAGDATPGPGNTFLVIGGLYNGSTSVTYYRIDIAEKNPAGLYEYLPLLRNHTYEFTLKSVARKGYATAEMAAEAGPENTEVVLMVENDSELRYYVSDSHYYVGATERIIRLPYSNTNQTYTLKLNTNYRAGWNVTVSGSETDPEVLCNWLTVNTSLPSAGKELSYTVTPNDAWAVRQAFLHINAGVEMVVTIEQDSKDAVELPTLAPTGNIPAAGQSRTITLTGMFDADIPVRVRNKYDTEALDLQSAPANAADGGVARTVTLNIPAWSSDDPRTLVFEYRDPGSSGWVIFHEDIQVGHEFELTTTLMEGEAIPEKPGLTDHTVTVSGQAWPAIYVRAIHRSSLERISDAVVIPAGNNGNPKTITLPVYPYGQWNDQEARLVDIQWSRDNVNWITLRSGLQKGWYRITGHNYKIYHPGSTERNDISHDGARLLVTVVGDFPEGVVEVRLGKTEVQLERTGGDGVSANVPAELFCRYNRTLLARNIPLSYRKYVNNAWQTWTYELNGTGNIHTFVQPSIACELPVTGRIIAAEDCLHLYYPQTGDPYLIEFMPWATAMGISSDYNRDLYEADVPFRNYPTYGGVAPDGNPYGGCSLYYEGDNPDDPVRGQGNWFLWGDGKNEYVGEGQFFMDANSPKLNQALGLTAGTEYWTFLKSGREDYMQTVQIYEDRWAIAYKYKPLIPNVGYDLRARCVRYPSAGEKEQFEKGYAPAVVTAY